MKSLIHDNIINRYKGVILEDEKEDGLMFEDGTG
jgi:hypothetical protein